MARPHAASLIEDAFHRPLNALLRGRGWHTRTISHTGYGSQDFVMGVDVLSTRPFEICTYAGFASSKPSEHVTTHGDGTGSEFTSSRATMVSIRHLAQVRTSRPGSTRGPFR